MADKPISPTSSGYPQAPSPTGGSQGAATSVPAKAPSPTGGSQGAATSEPPKASPEHQAVGAAPCPVPKVTFLRGSPCDEDRVLKVTAAPCRIGAAPPTKDLASTFKAYTPLVVQIEPAPGVRRTPSDICCVIDISGSMGAEASIQTAGGASESHGLCLLDIAKHGVKTVIHTLDEHDRLSIVLFNHTSQRLLQPTVMDEAGKKKAEEQLDPVSPGGGTNIWEGLLDALEAINGGASDGKRLGHIMLLTDGQTTGRDEVMTRLADFKSKHEALPGTISTFGFGYNIDSPLLDKLAFVGQGTYAFIPDAGFVGTVFVNTLSNLLSTVAVDVEIALDSEGCSVLGVLGEYEMSSTDDAKLVRIGTLQCGQSRSIVLAIDNPVSGSTVGARVSYRNLQGKRVETPFVEHNFETAESEVEVLAQLFRTRYVELAACAVAESMSQGNQGFNMGPHERMVALGKAIADCPAAGDERLKALLEDVNGQTQEALSRQDWFGKWGRHYLTSIKYAHRCQQCNNFKDPGVQVYGGELFQDIQEKADDTFNNLPAPKPAAPTTMAACSLSGATAAASRVNMSSYNDRYGVCMDARCLALVAGPGTQDPWNECQYRALGELCKGDSVAALDGVWAEVSCVVRRACDGGRAVLVELPNGGPRVTPHHPVLVQSEWRFPADLAEPEEQLCDAVCSVVLSGSAGLMVYRAAAAQKPSPVNPARQGQQEQREHCPVACVGLAHGLDSGIAAHPYFGTQRVLDDLARLPGFADGRVELQEQDVQRDEKTGLVSRLGSLCTSDAPGVLA